MKLFLCLFGSVRFPGVIGSDLETIQGDPERPEQNNVTSSAGFGVLEINAAIDAGRLVEFDSLGSRGRLTTKGGV